MSKINSHSSHTLVTGTLCIKGIYVLLLLIMLSLGYAHDLNQLAVDIEVELVEGEDKTQEKDPTAQDEKVLRLAEANASKYNNASKVTLGHRYRLCHKDYYRSEIPTPPPEQLS